MAIKVGNTYVSEAAYSYAKNKVNRGSDDKLSDLSKKFPDTNFIIGGGAFEGKGTNNISIAPNILNKMQEDPEKQLEYEALIYDCAKLQKNAPKYTMTGSKLAAQGFIINSDGTLSSWTITEPSDKSKTPSYSKKNLDRNKKEDWLDQILDNKKKRDKKELLQEMQFDCKA